MVSDTIFVVGSLCQNMVHHKLVQDIVTKIEPAQVVGSVYRLEVGYPVYSQEGDNTIQGELIHLQACDVIWPLLDQFFGFNSTSPEKSTFVRQLVSCSIADQSFNSVTYSMLKTKIPKTAQIIANGDWRADFASILPRTSELTLEEVDYIKKLGKCSGREVIPYTPLTRDLEKRGFVVDKGRRPALTKLGKEALLFLS